MSKEQFLISGKSGFIGRELSRHLENIGANPVGVPRTGEIQPPVDVIIDLAAYGNYFDQKDPIQTYEVNVMRLLRMLDSADKCDYKAFVVCGSSSEYGKRSLPMVENMTPSPETFYAASKTAAVNMAKSWAIERNKPIVSIRPFSVTGPGEQSRHLIPTLIRSCILGEHVKLVPDPVHDFVDVRDVVSGIMLLVEKADQVKGEVFNIGSGIQHSNFRVLELVEKITGKKANVEITGQQRDYDNNIWVADNNKLKALGWHPRFSLEDSIIDMVRDYV